MEAFFCPACQHWKAARDGIQVDIVTFMPVTSAKSVQEGPTMFTPLPVNATTSWRRVTQPTLMCSLCAPMEA